MRHIHSHTFTFTHTFNVISESFVQEGGETGKADGGEEDLDELAREIEATNADEEKETTVKNKKRRRRRRQEIRESKTKLEEDLSWLENASKTFEKSLLRSKYATLADLEQEMEKEGSPALQDVLDRLKEIQERKSKIEAHLNQLSDKQHVHHKSADLISSAKEVEPDLSAEESSSREFEMEQVEKYWKKINLQGLEQQLTEQIDEDQEKKICQNLANEEMENVKEGPGKNENDELVTEADTVSKVDTKDATDEEEAVDPTNEKEDNSNLFCGDREGNRMHEDVTILFSLDNRKKSEKSLEKVRLGELQMEEPDKTLPADKESKVKKEVSEESGEKCEEMSKDDNEVKRNLMEVVLHSEKRKRRRKKVKVCWLCAAAKTDEGFDLHWCAGCRKAR